MLADKIRYYQEEKKMLKNTPAGYKKEYPWLKEVDSLALANVQLNLEGAFRKFFRLSFLRCLVFTVEQQAGKIFSGRFPTHSH